MIATILLRCPSCRARIKAPVQLIGQSRRCPGCGSSFIVQRSIPEDAGPLVLLEDRSRPRRDKSQYRSA